MSLRSRVRPWWSAVVVVLVVAGALAALGSAAISSNQTEANRRDLQRQTRAIEADLRGLWAASDTLGRVMSSAKVAATDRMRANVGESIAAAAGLAPEKFERLQTLFRRYDARRRNDLAPVLASPDLAVIREDPDAVEAMIAESGRLERDISASLDTARDAMRRDIMILAVALGIAVALLAALLLPARRAAARSRRRAQELELQRELEERFQPVFEHHPQPMLVYDVSTYEFLAANQSMTERYGYSHEELMAMRIFDIHPPEDHPALESLIRGEQVAPRSTWIHRTKFGDDFEAEVHARSMTFGGRSARMVLAIDVTSRNEIARALAESEERHRTLVDAAQEGIVVFDVKGVVHLMNARMGEILGLDATEQIGLSILEQDSTESTEFIKLSVEPGFEKLVSEPQEIVLTREDGDRRVLLASSAPWSDGNGQANGTVVMCTDITERKLSEEHILESDALKSAMLDSSLDGIFTVGADGRILEFNRAAEEIFQIPRGEAIGRVALELLVPIEHRAGAERKFGSFIAADTPARTTSLRLIGWRADGSQFPAEVTVARTDAGEAYATVHVRDITERELSESMLRARARQQAVVAGLGAFSLQAQLIEEVYAEVAVAIKRALGIEYVSVATLADDVFKTCAVSGWTGPLDWLHSPSCDKDATVLADGPLVVDTRITTSPAKPRLVAEGLESGLIVGVFVGGEMRGILSAHSATIGAFGADERYFMQSVANVVGSALVRHETQLHMRDLALHDSLTKLPNRAVFEERLVEWAETATQPAAVAFVDVDHFKVLNDALGHKTGDQLLCALAPRFGEALGDSVLVARFGGDEFVVLIEEIEDETVAKVLGDRLLDTLTAPVEIDGRPHHVSVSIGLKLVRPGEDDPQSAVRGADSAMYQAKERGRGRVEMFDEKLHQRVVDRLRVDRDLRDALGCDDQIWCAYQPLISARTREIVGIEALARWRHPELGELAPADFIPAAEELGLIGMLGWHILDRAIRDAAELVKGRATSELAFVSVNLSPQQLADPSLAPRIAVLLDDVGLTPDRLTLEVTETTLMADTEAAQRGLEDLASLGVRLELDDFGTGFSSMAYLSRMPVSGLKIDRSFIADVDDSASSAAIVTAIVSMARALDLDVVAEGVETEGQAAVAVALGCDKLQGYLFSRPVRIEEIASLSTSLSAVKSVAA